MEQWELKMISQGRSDVVRAKSVREPTTKTQKKNQ